jgi:hypothetical protein
MLSLGLIAVVWANLPYMVGFLTDSENLTFGGFIIFPQDGFSYLAKMRQGAEGAWLFRLPYTTEQQQGQPLFLLYLAAGHLSRLLRTSLLCTYHLARLLGSGLLLASSAQFISLLGIPARGRLIAWVLTLFCGGVDFLISLLRPEYVAYATVAPDAFLYSILYGPPHITFAMAFLLWLISAIIRSLETLSSAPSWRTWAAIAVGTLLMSLTRPEYMGVLLSVLAVYWLALAVKRRRLLIREAAILGCVVLPGTLYAIYVYLISKMDPAIAAWTAQNPFTTPPLHKLAAGMGPFFILGSAGLISRGWWRDDRRLLIVAWITALPVMLYLPLSLSRRLVAGAQIALALPAGAWIDAHLLPWMKGRSWRRTLFSPLAGVVALVLFSYPVLFGLGAIGHVASQPDELFLSSDEIAALEWLDEQGSRGIVLSAEQTGNHIPAYSNATPVLGHPIETLAVDQKRADVAKFYAAYSTVDERMAILSRYSVDYIWWGPAEKAPVGFNLDKIPRLQHQFQFGEVEIWQVK